jgi:tRNA/rRNA methyltransferase
VEDRLGAVRFVLCRPRNPQNLGAAARALRCAGIGRWAIVDLRTHDFETARRVAVHAEDLLDKPQLCGDLCEALSGCSLSVATTGRVRPDRPFLSPRDAAERLIAARGEVAVVFGDERAGLSASEVEQCDLASCIPSAPDQPSWNLAQAIAIYAWELRAAALHARSAAPPQAAIATPDAFAAVERALTVCAESMGKPGLRRRLSRTLERAALSPREAALWTAFFKAAARQR